jgi:hypothetical protein
MQRSILVSNHAYPFADLLDDYFLAFVQPHRQRILRQAPDSYNISRALWLDSGVHGALSARQMPQICRFWPPVVSPHWIVSKNQFLSQTSKQSPLMCFRKMRSNALYSAFV